MLSAIEKARHSVCFASYLFETNRSGRAFIDALAAARARGVDVRVMLDGVGELYSFPRAGYLLKKQGIKVARFIPPRLLPPAIHINLRNHRKLLVVDGVTGFTGGMNIGDRHLRQRPNGRPGITDIHFQLTGPIVDQLLHVFDEDWNFATGESRQSHSSKHTANGNAVCRVVTDGPNEDLGKLAMIMTGAVALAHRRVAIMTPYFLPPPALVSALQAAALRGVEVSVILPSQSNQPLAHWATRNMLWELLQYGVRIYYQPPPFAHSKLLLIDDEYAHIGTANLDPRSLRLNFELVVEIFDGAFVAHMGEHFERVRSMSTEETLAGVDGRALIVRIRDAMAWLFSPYL
jgi:cardiolipin synthase